MPSPNATPTPITPPRVPLVDSRTGLIDRAWYLFFLSLFNAAVEVYDNPNVAPNAISLIASYDAALQALTQNVDSQPLQSDFLSQIAEMQKQIDGLQVQPVVDVGAINAALAALSSAPVTYTDDFFVAATDVWIINDKFGSYLITEDDNYLITESSDFLITDDLFCTATLPAASGYSGRVLYFQNYQAQPLVSASSNVVAIGGGAAGTSILLASAGDQCTLVSDGTNWIMMQYVPNNILLLE
jgi:hypothetical protein